MGWDERERILEKIKKLKKEIYDENGGMEIEYWED